MHLRILLLCPFLIFPLLASLQADETVLYSDDFADVEGFNSTCTDGYHDDSFHDRTREVHAYMSESIKGGALEIQLVEDDKTKGPDGKPGLISLSFEDIPKEADYCGFVYAGRSGHDFELPVLHGTVPEEALETITVSFRYRAVHKEKDKIGLTCNCRFEPYVDDTYNSRVDFGKLTATNEWQTFRRKLSSGTNKEAFLNAIATADNKIFQLVFGQEAEITNYDIGDTLQFDDVKVTLTK